MGLMHVCESWADADSRSMVPKFVVRPMHAPENLSDLHGVRGTPISEPMSNPESPPDARPTDAMIAVAGTTRRTNRFILHR